jgi:cation:H+ antiporter
MQQVARGRSFWYRLLAPFAVCLLVALPGVVVSLNELQISPVLAALATGVAIVAAAFMLGWVGEAAELDLAGGLAVGLLAVVTILPEYVVSVYFAFAAGTDPSMVQYASANVTGANRLLLGFGWPAMALVGFWALRGRSARKAKREQVATPSKAETSFGIDLDQESRTDLGFLILASGVCLLIPITQSLHLLVGILLVLIFFFYLWRQSHAEREEPELEGTAAVVGALPKWGRRAFMLFVFLLAAGIILASAEPFAHNLIGAGNQLGVDQYLLVQWVAPFASEAPEFTLAILFAFKGKPNMGLAVLLSSKVNQWTALAGSLPIAYVLGGGSAAIPMVGRQSEEFLLTAAQTLMGVALLLGLRLGVRASIALFGLFMAAFLIPNVDVRMDIAWLYLAVALFFFIRRRRFIRETISAPFKLPRNLV